MPCSSLYASWIARRRAVSSIARCIESVILSAYIMTFPSAFRAARPIVCTNERSLRKKPSLSASRIAIKETSGTSIPSRNKLIPIRISNSPNRKSRIISVLSSVFTSLCKYLTFKPNSLK